MIQIEAVYLKRWKSRRSSNISTMYMRTFGNTVLYISFTYDEFLKWNLELLQTERNFSTFLGTLLKIDLWKIRVALF